MSNHDHISEDTGGDTNLMIVGLAAPDRETVQNIEIWNHNPFLRIVLPCGNVREYLTKEEVPLRSIRCNCGEIEEEHWFITYTGKRA